jgi:dienelactone hydrolase
MTEHNLPTPTGPHAVGRCRFDIADGRVDPYARRPDTERVLPITAWYPADAADRSAPPAPYLPGWWRPVSWCWGLRARRVRTHARDGARPGAGRFPLVVLSPSANPALVHTALAEGLASHGYVVAAISHPHESLPWTAYADRRPRLMRPRSLGGALSTPGTRPYADDLAERAAVVTTKAADIAAVARAVQHASAGAPTLPVRHGPWAVIGHSFGGGAAVELATRGLPAAAVSLDGGLWRTADTASVTVPVLQLFAEHPEFVDPIPEVVARRSYASAVYAAADRATAVPAWHAVHTTSPDGHAATVVGATHTSFCDWPLLAVRSWSPARRALAGVTGPRVHHAVSAAVRPFLDRHLRAGTGDVDAALRAVAGLRVDDPAALFAPTPVAVS